MPEKKVKHVVVIRRDLKMRRGKEIAQGGHGFTNWLLMEAIHSYETQTPFRFSSVQLEWWKNQSVTKIVLQAESEEQLREVYRLAKEAGLNAHLVIDSGFTEFNDIPTETVVSIGPDLSDRIDKITGPEGKIPLKPY
jgi:PTH2 family peptidyl-tRNA hydrolase